jgi:hypothetical protein
MRFLLFFISLSLLAQIPKPGGSNSGGGSGGGGGTPASPISSLQFNNAGAFGGTSGVFFDPGSTFSGAVFTGPGLNDLTFNSAPYTGTTTNPTFTVIITTTGTPDKFKWKKDSGALSAEVSITGASQSLTEGIAITFGATTGHTLNNQWVAKVYSGLVVGDFTTCPATINNYTFVNAVLCFGGDILAPEFNWWYPNNLQSAPVFNFFISDGSVASPTPVTSGDYGGTFNWIARNTTPDWITTATFSPIIDGAPGATFVPSKFEWSVASATQLRASGFNLRANGNIEIYGSGTSSDLGIKKVSAGVLEVNNGTPGTTTQLNVGNLKNDGLSASLPVQTNASKVLISAAIDLTGSQVTGVLPIGKIPSIPTTSLTGDVSIANLGGSYVAGGGTANAQTMTLAPAPASLAALVGKQICWLPSANSTNGTVTLAVNGLTATNIKRFTGNTTTVSGLQIGDIQTIQISCVIYDGTQFLLLNPAMGPNTIAGNSSSPITTYYARNNGLGGIALNLTTPSSGGLFPGVMNSTGGDWTNGLARAGYLMAQSALQLGAGNSNITHTIFTNGNELISTGTQTDAGGSQLLQVAGGLGTNGEIIRGTRFTCTGDGCSPVDGGATAGTFTVTTTGAAAPIVTMGSSFTAPTKFSCSVSNLTTANLIRQSASTTTTATFSGVTVSGDTITFACHGY